MREGNKYVVTDGHHRVAAASKYYLKTGDPSILQNLINHSPHHPGPASNYGYKLRFFPKRWR